MSQTIEITISKDGSKVTTDAHGFVGDSCDTASRKIMTSVGVVVDSGHNDEYFLGEGQNELTT